MTGTDDGNARVDEAALDTAVSQDVLLKELLEHNGMFLVTVNNKRVVKVQRVAKPVTKDKIEQIRLSRS